VLGVAGGAFDVQAVEVVPLEEKGLGFAEAGADAGFAAGPGDGAGAAFEDDAGAELLDIVDEGLDGVEEEAEVQAGELEGFWGAILDVCSEKFGQRQVQLRVGCLFLKCTPV
jgi:hypothetical protein